MTGSLIDPNLAFTDFHLNTYPRVMSIHILSHPFHSCPKTHTAVTALHALCKIFKRGSKEWKEHFPVGSLHTASILILMQSKRFGQSLTIWCPMARCLMCLTASGGFRMLRYAYASHAFLSCCCMSDAAQNLGRKATSRMRGGWPAGYPPVCSVSVPRPWQRLLLPDCSLEILGTIHK